MKDRKEGIVEYFEGLVEYLRKLGYEDPRDKLITELERKCDLLLTAANTWQDKNKELEQKHYNVLYENTHLKARVAELEQSVTKGSERIGELLERIAELEHWFHGYRTPEMSMAAMQARLDAVRRIVEVRSDGVAREVWEALGVRDE